MTTWYVKDLSKLTDISVQTLHHYDKIGLLKPSVRFANGYRTYSERDLLKLQQIIALKFFGFQLSQIKDILEGEVDALDSFSIQSQLLEQKAQTLLEASKALNTILTDCNKNKSIPWKTIIKLIKVYRMTKKLEQSWEGKVFTQEQLKEYIDLKSRFTETQIASFEKNWKNLINEINDNLDKDPTSDFAMSIGKRLMDLINTKYGKDHAALRTAVWEKGYKEGQMNPEHAISPAATDWIDRSISAYYHSALLNVLDQVGTTNSKLVLKLWNDLLENMHGDDPERNQAVIDAALHDSKVSQASKNWLKKTFRS